MWQFWGSSYPINWYWPYYYEDAAVRPTGYNGPCSGNGLIQLFGYAPIVPSYFGRRYAYGHIVENDRHMIVSGGIGCSNLPIRFGRPPEIVVVDLEG